MRIKLLGAILVSIVPLAIGGIAKIPLKRPHNQATLGFIFISQTGSGSECSSSNPCSETTASTKPTGTVVFAFDGVYTFGPVTNDINLASCTSTNCAGVYSFILE